MATATLSSLQSDIATILDKTDMTARITVALNYTLRRIARKYDFSVLMDEDTSLTTVVSQFTYTLPSSTNRIYRLIYEDSSNSIDLVEIKPAEYDRRFPYPASLGDSIPGIFCRRNETSVDLAHPPSTASKTLRLFRSKFPTKFAAADSTSEYVEMDDVLVAGAVSEIYHQLGDIEESDSWLKKFQSELKMAHQNDIKTPSAIIHPQYFGGSGLTHGDYWKDPFYEG